MKLRSFARGATVVANVIAIAACGNRDVGTEAGSAELVVVVNTPIARAGAVAIHGPAASTMHVTATDTLRGLTAGEYLARADDASASDSLVSPVLNGVMSDSAVLLAADETRSITGTYTIRGGSGALWVGKWGTANLAEGFTSPQLAAAGVAAAADTVGSAGAMSTSSGTAFDSAGNLWVTDYINQEIHKYTPAQLASGASVPAVTISTQKEPWGIAFDTHGNLWVAGFDVPQAYEIDAAQLGGSGSVLPTDSLMSAYLDHGSALAFDRAGNLWEGTELGYIVSYTPAQLSAASHGEPSFAQLTPSSAIDGLAFDNSGNLWSGTEGQDVAMYSPAQQESGDLSTPARTLTASTGERTFGLAFNTHDAALPIASTLVAASRTSGAGRALRMVAANRAAPPVLHPNDGSRPGNVMRR